MLPSACEMMNAHLLKSVSPHFDCGGGGVMKNGGTCQNGEDN